MSNLENFNNIFVDLAESSYRGRPESFASESLTRGRQKILESGSALPYDYSKDGVTRNKKGEITSFTQGGTNLPNNGIVYLQPDPTVHEVDVKTNLQIPNPNGGYHTESYVTGSSQKGLLTKL